MKLTPRKKSIVGINLNSESKKLVSFYKPGKKIKTDYTILKHIFPILKSKKNLVQKKD